MEKNKQKFDISVTKYIDWDDSERSDKYLGVFSMVDVFDLENLLEGYWEHNYQSNITKPIVNGIFDAIHDSDVQLGDGIAFTYVEPKEVAEGYQQRYEFYFYRVV